jgi:DNA-binding CsgD family transcriptional regulator
MGERLDTTNLIDEIYEAAVVPERWAGVLDRLAARAGGIGTVLFAASPNRFQWTSSKAIHAIIADWVASPFVSDNLRGKRLVPLYEPRFLTDLDAITPDEIEHDPFYRDFLRPRGWGWCVGTSIRSTSGDSIVFSIERLHAAGPVPRETAAALDQFRPHLARASIISARLGLERARASVAALELVGLPAAIITGRHSVLAANELILKCAAFEIGAFDRVRLTDTAANERLQRHLDAAGDAGLSFPIRATGGRPAFVAHLVPLRRAGLDVFSGAAQLFYLTEVGRGEAPSAAILEALFDLSPAEAKVTRLLLAGGTVAGIAASQGNRPETVRGQLKTVFAKTGVRRQAELIQLLGGIQAPGVPGFGLAGGAGSGTRG